MSRDRHILPGIGLPYLHEVPAEPQLGFFRAEDGAKLRPASIRSDDNGLSDGTIKDDTGVRAMLADGLQDLASFDLCQIFGKTAVQKLKKIGRRGHGGVFSCGQNAHGRSANICDVMRREKLKAKGYTLCAQGFAIALRQRLHKVGKRLEVSSGHRHPHRRRADVRLQ